MFGVLNALILRPLNVPAGATASTESRTGAVRGTSRIRTISTCAIATAASRVWRRYNIIAGRAGYGQRSGSGVWVYETSGNYFDALAIQPYLGRVLHASDEHGQNSAPYIVLSHAYWHSHFQDDPGVVGRTVQLNKHPYTIVGVAPPEFHGTLLFFSPDIFVPIVNHEQLAGASELNERGKPLGL